MSFRYIPFLFLSLIMISCNKDEDENKPNTSQSTGIPSTIYGRYNVNTIRISSSGNYLWINDIVPNTPNSVYLINLSTSGVLGDSLLVEVDNGDLRIPAQTKPNTGWIGGTYTITGTGYYSEPQFMLTIVQSFSADTTTTYHYSMIGVKQ